MNVGVIGIGGVGGYFGGKLTQLLGTAEHDSLHIYFIARNQHLDAIKRNGLLLGTVEEGDMVCHPTLATDDFAELPELDLCLLCVKAYDLDNALKYLGKKIKADTVIIPLLNGVDIYERIRKHLTQGIVYPSCVYVGTHIEHFGKVTQNGGSCTILLGEDPWHPGTVPKPTLELFAAARIKYQWNRDPYPEIWRKYIFIAAYGMVTAGENAPIGRVLEDKELRGRVLGIMSEIVDIARRQGVDLPEDVVQASFNQGQNFPYETKTSFQRDFEQGGKPNEGMLYGDTIVRMGESAGVGTPITRMVNAKLEDIKRAYPGYYDNHGLK